MKIKQFTNKIALVPVACAVALMSVGTAQAEVDADITAMVTDATTVFTSIKALVITVVGFFIVLGFVKLAKRAR